MDQASPSARKERPVRSAARPRHAPDWPASWHPRGAAAASGSCLGCREFDQNVDRVAGDAERHRSEHGAEKREGRKRIKRSPFHGRVAKPERTLSRDEKVGNGVIMAAGAAQPDTVPGIEDFALRGGEEQEAHDRGAVGPKARLIPVQNPAAAGNPGGMLTTASQRPPSRDAIAACDCHGGSRGA